MIRRNRIIRSSVLFCFIVTALVGCKREAADIRARPVIKVNDKVLSAGDLSDRLAARLKDLHILSARDTSIVAQTKNAIVQDFIVQVVTEAWAQANQIFVRKEQLQEEMDKTIKSYPDDIAFRKALADEGLTYDRWEALVRYTVLERLVQSEISKNAPEISAKEISDYYQANKQLFVRPAAVRLRQIVTDSEVNAERIRKELASGKSLASLAKKFSITPEAANGGDTGWIEKGTSDVFDSALRMGIGQRSRVIKSPYGYHIFEVLDKRNAKTLSLEEAKPKIVRKLHEERGRKAYMTWLEEQVLKARVFKDDDLLASIQVFSRGEK